MPISQKIKDVAIKAKTFVLEHKQAVLNGVMLIGISGVAAAVVVLNRELDHQDQIGGENDYMLMQRGDYARERIYDIERHVGMPLNSDDKRYHDYLESKKANSIPE